VASHNISDDRILLRIELLEHLGFHPIPIIACIEELSHTIRAIVGDHRHRKQRVKMLSEITATCRAAPHHPTQLPRCHIFYLSRV
jgi:hypothetical protein